MRKVIDDNWGGNSIVTSMYEKDLPAFQAFVARGEDLNEPIAGGWTYLQAACYLNRVDFVKCLLESEEVDLSAASQESHSQTALHIACHRGHTEIVRILLREHAKRSSTEELRNTA